MMMVGVMMVPRGVMPGMMPIVDSMVMREGVISSPMRCRMVCVCVSMFCMAMMPVAAVPVRMMSSVPVPAAGEGRLTISHHQTDHDHKTEH
jgi:hypothetical protein